MGRSGVSRIDPTVMDGNVTVDVSLGARLPQGARPDLSVVGTITLEKLDDVLNVGRPVFASSEGPSELFKVVEDGRFAIRSRVQFGRTSVSTIEVLEGLEVGEEIILSDMSQWDGRLNQIEVADSCRIGGSCELTEEGEKHERKCYRDLRSGGKADVVVQCYETTRAFPDRTYGLTGQIQRPPCLSQPTAGAARHTHRRSFPSPLYCSYWWRNWRLTSRLRKGSDT
jgi:hypothetical protein